MMALDLAPWPAIKTDDFVPRFNEAWRALVGLGEVDVLILVSSPNDHGRRPAFGAAGVLLVADDR
jgi:hypothetical protein